MQFAKQSGWLLVFLILAACLSSSQASASQDNQWIRHEPGGETMCARGTPYSFYTHEGSSDDVLVYFEGGGGCWDGGTCRPGSTVFDDEVDPTTENDNPGMHPYGIMDLNDDENPFKDHDWVYVPYCTGDGHVGSADVTYTSSGTTFEIHHRGFANASAALDWLYTTYPEPESITAVGCSAGTLGSFFHTPYIAQHYIDDGHADIPIAQISDSGGFDPSDTTVLLPVWNVRASVPSWIEPLQSITNDNLNLTEIITNVAEAYPNVTFAMFNSSHDSVISQFLQLMGSEKDFNALMLESVVDLSIKLPNFRAFVGWGDLHCLTPGKEFYHYMTNGVAFRDWAAALASGQPVDNVFCEDCETEQFR